MGYEKIRKAFRRQVMLANGVVENLTDGSGTIVARTGGVLKIRSFIRRPILLSGVVGGVPLSGAMTGVGAGTAIVIGGGAPITPGIPAGAMTFSDTTPLQFSDGSYLELAS